MTALAFAGAALRRITRDRTALFFLIILPVLVIVLVGLTVRGADRFRVGIVQPRGEAALARTLTTALDRVPALQISRYSGADAARTAVRRGEIVGAVLLPAGTAAQAATAPVQVSVVTSASSSDQQAVRAAIDSAIAPEGARLQAAAFAAQHAGVPFEAALARAEQLQRSQTPVSVHTDVVDSASSILPLGYSYSAPTMLVLFVFINATAGAAAIVQTRRLGIYDRASAAPVRTSGIVLGEVLAVLAVAVLQSLLIVAVGALGFGVSWGDPLAAAALVGVWALVGTGAGVLAGTVFRTSEQASAVGPALGIALGMLGGCMWPLEIVSPAMRTIGHAAPQAWAVDAWTALIARNGDLAAIGRQLAVLGAIAVVLIGLAVLRLARQVLQPART